MAKRLPENRRDSMISHPSGGNPEGTPSLPVQHLPQHHQANTGGQLPQMHTNHGGSRYSEQEAERIMQRQAMRQDAMKSVSSAPWNPGQHDQSQRIQQQHIFAGQQANAPSSTFILPHLHPGQHHYLPAQPHFAAGSPVPPHLILRSNDRQHPQLHIAQQNPAIYANPSFPCTPTSSTLQHTAAYQRPTHNVGPLVPANSINPLLLDPRLRSPSLPPRLKRPAPASSIPLGPPPKKALFSTRPPSRSASTAGVAREVDQPQRNRLGRGGGGLDVASLRDQKVAESVYERALRCGVRMADVEYGGDVRGAVEGWRAHWEDVAKAKGRVVREAGGG